MPRKLIPAKKHPLFWQLVQISFYLTAACGPRQERINPVLPDFERVFEICSPSVVSVNARRQLLPSTRQFFAEKFGLVGTSSRSVGSGFVFEKPGRIVTCASVIENAEEIWVELATGRSLTARVEAFFPEIDLALLQIDPGASPPPLLAENTAQLHSGQWVASFGYPYGLSHSLTAGIIASLVSDENSKSDYDLIVFDGAVNPGCNGGPLVAVSGRVVGVNLVGKYPSSFGQALAINWVQRLAKLQPPIRGWLGMTVRSPTEEELASIGTKATVLVTRVHVGGPAEKAGVTPGEFILEIDGQPLNSLQQLLQKVHALRPGQRIELRLLGEKGTRKVTLVAESPPNGLTPEGAQ